MQQCQCICISLEIKHLIYAHCTTLKYINRYLCSVCASKDLHVTTHLFASEFAKRSFVAVSLVREDRLSEGAPSHSSLGRNQQPWAEVNKYYLLWTNKYIGYENNISKRQNCELGMGIRTGHLVSGLGTWTWSRQY